MDYWQNTANEKDKKNNYYQKSYHDVQWTNKPAKTWITFCAKIKWHFWWTWAKKLCKKESLKFFCVRMEETKMAEDESFLAEICVVV